MSTVATPHLAIVENDPGIQVTLQDLLSSVHINAECFASAGAFWAHEHYASRCQCVVADAGAPGVLGAQFVQQLRQAGIAVPVILLLEPNDVTSAVDALKCGAADVLEKPFNGQILLDAVHDAQHKARAASHTRERRRDLEARFHQLTSREFEVAVSMVKGLANREIAGALGISPKTVEVYRSRVMRKTEAASLCDLIRMAIKAHLLEEEITKVGAR